MIEFVVITCAAVSIFCVFVNIWYLHRFEREGKEVVAEVKRFRGELEKHEKSCLEIIAQVERLRRELEEHEGSSY